MKDRKKEPPGAKPSGINLQRSGFLGLFFFLGFDNFQAAELFTFALTKNFVDGLDGLLHLGDLDVAQGVGALLGLLDGFGQADDAGLDLGQLHRQGLDLVEFEVGHIQRAVGGLHIIIQPDGCGGLQREGG